MINYQEELKKPEVLEALRNVNVPVKDDWGEFYPIDKIILNIMYYSDNILKAVNSNKYPVELSFIKDDIDSFFSFIFIKTKDDPKLGYLEISIRYNNEPLVSRSLQLKQVNQDERMLYSNLMHLAEGSILSLMRLPLTKDYIDILSKKDETYTKLLNAVKDKFNPNLYLDFKDDKDFENSVEKLKHTYIKLLENSNPRLAKLIKELVNQEEIL